VSEPQSRQTFGWPARVVMGSGTISLATGLVGAFVNMPAEAYATLITAGLILVLLSLFAGSQLDRLSHVVVDTKLGKFEVSFYEAVAPAEKQARDNAVVTVDAVSAGNLVEPQGATLSIEDDSPIVEESPPDSPPNHKKWWAGIQPLPWVGQHDPKGFHGTEPQPRVLFTEAAQRDLDQIPNIWVAFILARVSHDFYGGVHRVVAGPHETFTIRWIGNSEYVVIYRPTDDATDELPAFVILRVWSEDELAQHPPK
jgi:hypothetical protein